MRWVGPGNEFPETHCIREFCAWWVKPPFEQCAVLALVTMMTAQLTVTDAGVCMNPTQSSGGPDEDRNRG